MPNLVLKKGGQTFRFGLHEEKSVTRGKYITVPFNA
nr:MAG TPA: Retinal tissue protein [Caudoviricetes sp.]